MIGKRRQKKNITWLILPVKSLAKLREVQLLQFRQRITWLQSFHDRTCTKTSTTDTEKQLNKTKV